MVAHECIPGTLLDERNTVPGTVRGICSRGKVTRHTITNIEDSGGNSLSAVEASSFQTAAPTLVATVPPNRCLRSTLSNKEGDNHIPGLKGSR